MFTAQTGTAAQYAFAERTAVPNGKSEFGHVVS